MLARIRSVVGTEDEGASAVEYGLLVAGIAAVIIVVVFALGDTITGLFEGVDNCIENAGADGCETTVDGEAEGSG